MYIRDATTVIQMMTSNSIHRTDTAVEVFESYGDDTSVKTGELARRLGPTARCKQYQVIDRHCALHLHE